MKKIIGYKLKDDCIQYEAAACKIAGTLNLSLVNGIAFMPDSPVKEELEKAGVLDLWFEPVYKEIPEFKVGDWVIVLETDVNYYDSEKCPQKLIDIKPVGFPYRLMFSDGHISSYANIRHATPSEIEAHLIKLAKEKGFVDGVTVSHSYNKHIVILNNGADYTYFANRDLLTYCGWGVYKDGVWATIVPQEKIVHIVHDDGSFPVKVTKSGIEYGYTIIKVEQIEKLLETNYVGSWSTTAEKFDIGCKHGVTRDSLKALLAAYKSL